MSDEGLKNHGYDVLNPQNVASPGKPTQVVNELNQARELGRVKVTRIPFGSMDVKPRELKGATVVPIAVITHVEESGVPGKFNGYIVGEELKGARSNHPLLLIPRGQIEKSKRPVFKGK